MPGHLLLIFGSSLPLSVPRHRQKKKSWSQLPVRPGTVPSVLVYLVGFVKALRNAGLSLPLELVQTVFKLSARTFFLRSRLHVPFTQLRFLTSHPSLDYLSIIFPSCGCWLRPRYPVRWDRAGGWWHCRSPRCCPFMHHATAGSTHTGSCPKPPITDSLSAF